MIAALSALPLPPRGHVGWPWTEGCPTLPDRQEDGTRWPLITVVTPSYNQGQYLEETIRSVLLQGYPELEFFVVDGGSHDNSPELIERYSPWLTWWTSEPDQGQVDAICKGLARATGEIFNWVNSDDVLQPGGLAAIAGAFGPATHLVAGAGRVFGDDVDPQVLPARALTTANIIRGSRRWQCLQPALWLRRRLVAECGGFDPSMDYYFDMELYIRYLERFPRVTYLDAVVASFRYHAESKTRAHAAAFQPEYQRTVTHLAQHGVDSKLRSLARRRVEELKRHGVLAELLADQSCPRWRSVIRLAVVTLAKPRPRLVHMGVAALLRLLGGREWPVQAMD